MEIDQEVVIRRIVEESGHITFIVSPGEYKADMSPLLYRQVSTKRTCHLYCIARWVQSGHVTSIVSPGGYKADMSPLLYRQVSTKRTCHLYCIAR